VATANSPLENLALRQQLVIYKRILARYFLYYHQARTHLALDKDAPDVRPVELPEAGRIVEIPEVGGLHHRYVRRAA
jgi:putative transposase